MRSFRQLLCSLHTSSSFLQPHFAEDIIEAFLILRQFWDLDVDTTSQSSSQVAWACQHVTQMVIVHVLLSDLLHLFLDLGDALAEALEHSQHVASLLHGNETCVILLVNPHQESLVIVVPGNDTSASSRSCYIQNNRVEF